MARFCQLNPIRRQTKAPTIANRSDAVYLRSVPYKHWLSTSLQARCLVRQIEWTPGTSGEFSSDSCQTWSRHRLAKSSDCLSNWKRLICILARSCYSIGACWDGAASRLWVWSSPAVQGRFAGRIPRLNKVSSLTRSYHGITRFMLAGRLWKCVFCFNENSPHAISPTIRLNGQVHLAHYGTLWHIMVRYGTL